MASRGIYNRASIITRSPQQIIAEWEEIKQKRQELVAKMMGELRVRDFFAYESAMMFAARNQSDLAAIELNLIHEHERLDALEFADEIADLRAGLR